MKKLFTGFFLLLTACMYAQPGLVVSDIATTELRVMENSRNLDSTARAKIFIDSIYTPYRQFWNGYLGEGPDVAGWLEEAIPLLDQWKAKNVAISSTRLVKELNEVAGQLQKMTGYKAHGNWYIVFGPAWTDLGGLGDFAMLIDLAHKSNNTNEQLLKMFPHELTHQVITNVNTHKDTTAMGPIIGEGFAVWMNQYYWKDKYTLAENLGYSQEELATCDKNLGKLKQFLVTHKYATDAQMIDAFRNRDTKLNPQLPGAIGYYLGYKIIEAYVKKFGENAWKDIFTKSPAQVYEQSGFAE